MITYSCVSGGYDDPIIDGRIYLPSSKRFIEERLNAKIVKVLPHHFLPETDYTLWLDANMRLKKSPEDLIKQLGDFEVACFKHPIRDCLYDEAVACIALGLDSPEAIKAQIDRYREAGFKAHKGLYSCGFLFRKNTAQVNYLSEKWWIEICKGSWRDQLSFSYIFEDRITTIPGKLEDYVELMPHKYTNNTQLIR